MNLSSIQPFFFEPLVDLSFESSKYSSVYSPQPEVGRPRHGVTEQFLDKAESYFEKYQSYDYIFSLIKRELDVFGINPGHLGVDFGSGFGNSVIPILEHYPELRIIAVDISPDLLAILNREITRRCLDSRCAAIAMDAQNDYFVDEFADIVFGGAVLHHMVDPAKVVRTSLKLLRPGGHAIFLEPFENGHALLRIAYEEILAEGRRRGDTCGGFDALKALSLDIAVRTHRENYPGYEQVWPNLDDKWMFTRTYFERVAKEVGAKSVSFRSFQANERCFSQQTEVALSLYCGLTCPQALPDWAWKILDCYDKIFTDELKQELIIEGSIVFEK